jgi:hypothetical protein
MSFMLSVIMLDVLAPSKYLTNIFGAKAEQLLGRYFLMLLMVTIVGRNVPKYGTQNKSCSLKYATKFFSAEMLVKQSSYFNAIYIMLVTLCIAQIGLLNQHLYGDILTKR